MSSAAAANHSFYGVWAAEEKILVV